MNEKDPHFESHPLDEELFEEEDEERLVEDSQEFFESQNDEQRTQTNSIHEGILEEEEEEEEEDENAVSEKIEEPIENRKQVKKQRGVPQQKKKKRARNIVILLLCSSFINYLIIAIVMHLSPSTINKDPNGLFRLLPGNFIVEMMLIWVIIIIGFFLFYPLLPLLSKAYIFIHKLVKLNKYEYSIVTTDEHYLTIKEVLERFSIPYLFSFILGYWFSTWFFLPGLSLSSSSYYTIATLLYFFFALILMPVVILLVLPLWLLDDAGIIAMKKRKEGERSIPNIEGPSVFFVNIFIGSGYTLAIVTAVDFFRKIFDGGFKIDILFSFLFAVFILMPNTILLIIYLYDFVYRHAKRRLNKITPNKLVDKMPKTVIDITALDPFYIPEELELSEQTKAPSEIDLKEFSDFEIETEGT